jgi:prepilin-type N-terminal cleavage/methylation domain-containing protein
MYRRSVGRAGARQRRGFTLMETLVALTVVSVAVSVFVGLFGRSVDLGRLAHDRNIAAQAAQAQLALITGTPGLFLWKRDAVGADGTFPVKLAEDDPAKGNIITPPSAVPTDNASAKRTQNAYGEFRWRAFARLPKGKEFYEVTVAVTWSHAGREQMLALTSAAPRAAVEAGL